METEKMPSLTLKSLMNRDDVKAKFQEMLGNRANQFVTSILQIAASNEQLAKADPMSIYNAACTAAILDLPINNNLGFAYIIPYKTVVEELRKNDKGKEVPMKIEKYIATFQMGTKGYKQLALRTGQFEIINATDVREGEMKDRNRLTGEIKFEWMQDEVERLKKPIIGYVSYFRLHNGFSQTLFMTVEELTAHGKKYSQTFKSNFGLWKDDFNSMCRKTVEKLNLSKSAPLSVEMQRAVISDQAIIKNPDTLDVEYIDNTPPVIDKEAERIELMIKDATSPSELEKLKPNVTPELLSKYNERMDEILNPPTK